MPSWTEVLNNIRGLKATESGVPQQDRRVVVEEDNTKKFIDALEALGKAEVLIGIPDTAANRSDGAISNAALGYIHEFGSPINNIPARPFLVPGVTNSRDQWLPRMEKAGQAAMNYDEGGMDIGLNQAGTIAVSAVKRTIQSKIPPPLKPATIAARQRRTPSRTSVDTTPLIDTGQMINSITYVVRRR